MLWRNARRSSNIEDRRGMRPGLVGGGIGGVVILLIAALFGFDPGVVLDSDYGVDASGPAETTPADDETKQFVSSVLGLTEDAWSDIFRQNGGSYQPPTLVLFSGAVRSACGFGQAAMGPFYCPADHKVYLDTSFFQELHNKFQAPGDFAQAYVVAHEVGHHVQNLTGAMDRHSGKSNEASVRMELQADCYAGVWANRSQQFLEAGDVDEALRAASMIGDDRLQMESQGYVVPESFTHGSAEQRATWFRKGMEAGSPDSCNTFDVARP